MFSSPISDVAFGLMFAYLTVSLAAGTLVETFSSITKWRSKTLLSGIKALVNDPNFKYLAQDLYKHAAISPRDDGKATTEKALKLMPSYVDPKQFAGALLDVVNLSTLASVPADLPAMVAAINAKIPSEDKVGNDAATIPGNPQLNQLLVGIVHRAEGDIGKIRDEVAAWFDNGMDRLSGAYKRWSQWLTFVLALLLAVMFNVNSISIARELWTDPEVVRSLKVDGPGQPALEQSLATLANFAPVGWNEAACKPWSGCAWGTAGTFMPNSADKGWAIVGWLITALASLFGAPFWFDALQKVARLKSTGPSPAEKIRGNAASA